MNDLAPSAVLVAARKPMARALRVTLFEREVRERLSGAAIELLLSAAEVLSEGGVAPANPALEGRAAGREAWFGSTMLTIDLARVAAAVREPCDEARAARIAALLVGDTRIGRRVRKVAEREAERMAGRRLEGALCEVRVRSRGTTVFVDVDVEEGKAAPAVAAPAGGGR